MIGRSARHVKDLRIALDGCYPSFWHTDLVMRTIRSFVRPHLVSRLLPHDLLIRGPFSRGSKRLRLVETATQIWQAVNTSFYRPLTLHVSSENHALPNYQSFDQSECDYGIGHEVINSPSYFRSPHWHNYIDFSCFGIDGPDFWPRLGRPIQINELTRPIQWNKNSKPKAAFVCSNLTEHRIDLMNSVNHAVSLDGYGQAFNPRIKNHSDSGFTKRELLSNYQYCLCPENSLAPGYYTEKIPEAYISGSIPITYCDPMVSMDFSSDALINLYDFHDESGFDSARFKDYFLDRSIQELLLGVPLITYKFSVIGSKTIEFISNICSISLS